MPRANGPRTGKNFAEVIFEQYHAELGDAPPLNAR